MNNYFNQRTKQNPNRNGFYATVEDTSYNNLNEGNEFFSPFNHKKISKSLPSIDDFSEHVKKGFNPYKAIKSGRQRKKIAARTKGGEFQAKRKKRRIYFCCISSELDMEKLSDKFQKPYMGMRGKMYDDVLHLFMDNIDNLNIPISELSYLPRMSKLIEDRYENESTIYIENHPSQLYAGYDHFASSIEEAGYNEYNRYSKIPRNYMISVPELARMVSFDDEKYNHDVEAKEEMILEEIQSSSTFWDYGGKEIFVFDFGAIVFWGYHRHEVSHFIDLFRSFIVKGPLSDEEFEAGEDDVAFVTSFDTSNKISIANDVITMPDQTSSKSRLAVSFAVAQSAVLSIFEARIESKVEEYKYIPEALAKFGKVDLPTKLLGNMIGEVFVIRHDVNLHSEILDTPDYFWKEKSEEDLYQIFSMYMEMETRTEVLNKRLDLLRELLSVLQQQHENDHSVKLEWIVIWLIVISVVLETWAIVGQLLGLWK